MTIRLKRVYQPADPGDGYRILVDRLWPRGMTKAAAHVDLWLRPIAPSNELRTWYGHDVVRWDEFQSRYREELATHGELLDLVLDIERHEKTVTLLFGAKDEEHNEAAVILSALLARASA